MPELPEVEHGRRLAESVARGRVVRRVWCARDPIVLDGVSAARMRGALTGKRVKEVCRRGKQLWFRMDRPPHPLFHFGMTGAFVTPESAPLKLASSRSGPESEWPPRFSKIRFFFEDGGELVMTNKRRLGRIRLREAPEDEPPISRLGFDPLLDLPGPRTFQRLLVRRTGNIKGLLLDQTFSAGVGNWIADEVLFQARIDPRREVGSLSIDEAEALRKKLRLVIRKAVEADADKSRFPKAWLFHRRWGRDPEAKTARGEKIEFLEVAGRTTAWVPAVQR
ncbi:MAG TPA: DNA-formamidopyrimidine glycosylase family protein [bacterium]|nr:DNA-formamidopyrimidine glycosylase family protein [bacterium]